MQHHKYSLSEIEGMIPWEKEIYITMLHKFIEEEKLRIQQQQQEIERLQKRNRRR